MKVTCAALAIAATLVCAVPASAQGCCQAVPVQVVVENPGVWVNPGVYVSQHSAVTRNYPYVGCCLPAYENWSYMRPYVTSLGIQSSRVALPRYSQRRAAEEPPHAADNLHYPDGRAIERFR